MIKDIIKTYHPEAIRLFLLSKHYRSPIDFTDKALDEAVSGLDKIYSLLDRIEKNIEIKTDCKEIKKSGDVWKRFTVAMDDDFNSARGIGVLFEAVRKTNRLIDNKDFTDDILKKIKSIYADIIKIGSVLGIIDNSPASYFSEKKGRGIEKTSVDPDVIDKMIQERTAARKAKDWAMADKIREQLAQMNIIIEDSSDGTTWKVQG